MTNHGLFAGAVTTRPRLTFAITITSVAALCLAAVCASPNDRAPGTGAVHTTRSGILEFEANGYPSRETVRRVQEEVDYQRAVQANIHFIPAVAIMQWRNAHFGPLGGKPGDLIIYRTTEQKMPIITANDTTTYVLMFADLSDTDDLLMYEVPAGPTGGGINDPLSTHRFGYRHGGPRPRQRRRVPHRASGHESTREPRRRLCRHLQDQHGP